MLSGRRTSDALDPTATSNAVSLLGEMDTVPRAALERTFAEYLAGFRRRRRNEIDWNNYTAYEVRIVGALVHLGERASANGKAVLSNAVNIGIGTKA